MKRKIGIILLGIILATFYSCSNELTMYLPEGSSGASAYELWVEGVNNGTVQWDKGTDLNNFFLYMKGQDGQNGTNGKSAYDLWVAEVEKGIDDPHNPGNEWPKDKTSISNFWLYITGAPGQNGSVPNIDNNGNWVIDGIDTGIAANGKDGSVVTIGANGNWFIDGVDTGKRAFGEDGQSAYALWVAEVAKGLDNPHKAGEQWPKDKTSTQDFWDFLKGQSAYEIWVDGVTSGAIDWNNGTDLNNFFLYLKGQDGKDGVDGKSAYDLWVAEVSAGITNPQNPSEEWPKDKTSMNDFWMYLAGAPGQDGSTPVIGGNGNWIIDGKDTGMSAKGDTGEAGEDGSIIFIGVNGNWYIDGVDTSIRAFGKDGKDGEPGAPGAPGADGQSAYALWVAEVAKGLADPHNPGQEWPKTQTTTQDFWLFLKGEDGENGEDGQPGGNTGQPGADIKVIAGVPNVIPQYVNQSNNEFIRWEDGGVAYIVYDNVGTLAAGAKVKGLPGVIDANKVYTADSKGGFIVPKEDLPVNIDVALRRGKTNEVEYTKAGIGIVKEASATNTYVPNRMFIRVKMYADPSISSDQVRFYPIVERQTNATEWATIPSYLGDLSQEVMAYELSNPNDPTSYTSASNNYIDKTNTNNYKINISAENAIVKVNRLRRLIDYYPTPDYLWDGNKHYFTIVLNTYYGEQARADLVMEMPPIQAMPLIKDVKAYSYRNIGGKEVLDQVSGTFDIARASIDPSLLFKTNFTKTEKTSGSINYSLFTPIMDDYAVASNVKQFKVSFNITGNNVNNNANLGTIVDADYLLTTPWIEASVILECATPYFYQLNTIGYFEYGTAGDLNTLKIRKRNDPKYVFTDISIPYSPNLVISSSN